MSSCERVSQRGCTCSNGGRWWWAAAAYLVDALESHVCGCRCVQAVVGVVRVYSEFVVVVVGEVEGGDCALVG